MSDTRIELGDHLDAVAHAWERALIAHGHRPKYDEHGQLETHFMDIDVDGTGHSGPGCEVCWFAECMFCYPDPAKADIPACKTDAA